MTDTKPAPSAYDLPHWMRVSEDAGRMVADFWADAAKRIGGSEAKADAGPAAMPYDLWTQGFATWQNWMTAAVPGLASSIAASADKAATDKRFAAEAWRGPVFDAVSRTYLAVSERMMAGVEQLPGLDAGAHEKLRMAMRGFVDAMSPSNFLLTNPQVMQRTMETGGANLLKGLQHMLRDLGAGQVTHSPKDAFEVGRNVATTPGKVIAETPLYQLIHYAPSTPDVFETPLVIFPPWINRFYILDLSPEKSFVRWAVEQGLSVFMVSWKSADHSIRDILFDDYVGAQVEAIDAVRSLLDAPAVHTIGYCVAGTTLAATLALREARGEADSVASATFFTAQVDFSDPGELQHLLTDESLAQVAALSKDTGVLDGRYMAAAFNSLRGRDLIWNYVVANYLLGEDYRAFDMLHWNGDTTNLPAAWHNDYLRSFYRGNDLAGGRVVVDGVPIDLSTVRTPTYVQAGRDDHIAPAASVWKITEHFGGPLRFVLAGSGHIAGVVNPPSAKKYGYWVNEAMNEAGHTTLDAFVEGATEHKGSWWPDWLAWIAPMSGERVPADGARVPGQGALAAIEDAPGRYVKAR